MYEAGLKTVRMFFYAMESILLMRYLIQFFTMTFLINFMAFTQAKPLMETISYSQACVVYSYEEPYQYIQDKAGISVYQGVDIDILSAILGPQRVIHYQHLNWADGLKAVENGSCDFVLGAFYSKARSDYAYFSVPYRKSYDRVYRLKGVVNKYKTISDFLKNRTAGVKRLGVLKSMRYTSDVLNVYIRDHPSKFIFLTNERELIQQLIENKIDAFFGDKMKMELLLWRSGFHSKIVASEIDMGYQQTHFLMSKKTISSKFANWFNFNLKKFKTTPEYDSIFRTYSVPLFIGMLTNTFAYHVLEILGTMFYAISGLILAREAKFSLIGAFILAMLPGIGGGVMRDLLLSRDPVGVLRTPLYFLTVVLTTLAFYLFIRARRYFKVLHKISDYFHDHMFVKEFSIVQATDAFGLAVFTIIGVMVAVEVQATPLWLWGPTIAVLSSTGGGIVRDFFMGRGLVRTYFYETSFIWSSFLTFYIMWHTHNISANDVSNVILITLVGILLTRIAFLKSGKLTKDFWS